MRKRGKIYEISPFAIIFFWIIFTASAAYAELRIESVTPDQGVAGQELAVTITGTGFDENIRVFMYMDSIPAFFLSSEKSAVRKKAGFLARSKFFVLYTGKIHISRSIRRERHPVFSQIKSRPIQGKAGFSLFSDLEYGKEARLLNFSLEIILNSDYKVIAL